MNSITEDAGMPASVRSELSQSEQVALAAALDDALRVAASALSADEALFFQFIVLRDDPARSSPELRDLLSMVSTIPALGIFDQAEQSALGNRERVGFRFLTQWLVSRAQQVGSERAVGDLSRYLAVDEIDLCVILGVDGVVVDRRIEFNGYDLAPWQDLPNSKTKWRIAVRGSYSGTVPTAAVMQRLKVKRLHISPWGQQSADLAPSIEPMLDILRCLTAVAGAGIRLIEYWLEPPEWAPWVVSRSAFGVDSSILVMDAKVGQAEQSRLIKCVSCFLAKSDADRQRLRVPLDRLNRSYLCGIRSVDSAIELGIAIESLYAPSKLAEGIGFAVRTRAARFLGGSAQERRATSATVRDVYDLRSLAVHSGRFDTEHASRRWRDETNVRLALAKGQTLIAESLMRVIEEGEPSWQDLDIGAS